MDLKKKYWEGVSEHLENADHIRLRNRMGNLIKEGKLEMGAHSYGLPEFFIDKNSTAKIRVGKFCSIAEGVKIFNGDNHNSKWVSTFPFRGQWNMNEEKNDGHPFSKGDVNIGNDVWIGYGVTILSGATIGDGAIITAGAVVTGNVDAYTMAGGVPSKLIRKRFDENAIEKLMKMQWWHWPEEKVREAIPLLNAENIEAFLEKYS